MKFSNDIRENVAAYLENKQKVDSLQDEIFEGFKNQGIDTEDIVFQQTVGDLFAFGELESIDQLQEAINNYLKIQ